MMKRVLLLFLTALVIFAGCTSSPAPRPQRPSSSGGETGGSAQSQAQEVPTEYIGFGEGDSLGKAMNNAKIDAIRKSVVAIIGAGAEEANRGRLDEILYSTSNPNAYVDKNSMETLTKDNSGTIDEPNYVYEMRIVVNVGAVERILEANGITGGDAVASAGNTTAEPADQPTAALAPDEEDSLELTDDEIRFIRRYVNNMTYMVYFDEESADAVGQDTFLMTTAVGMANSYLTSNGIDAIDMDQIERIKEDQQLVYEEETGQEISIIQWVAQRLNADVYIEIDAVTEGETNDSNYYGLAKVNLKIFEAATGALLGSLPYSSPKTFSRVSEFDAISNALQSTIYKAMPIAVNQSKEILSKAFQRGIKYDLVIQKTDDARLMSRFRSRMRRYVESIETVYQSPEETKYEVYFIGSVEDLEDLMYEISEDVPGLEYMEPVMIRGKSLTFYSGL